MSVFTTTIPQNPMLPQLPEDSFDWQRWRRTDIFGMFGCACRSEDLFRVKQQINKYAVGYCLGEKLRCRPKQDHKAVMFLFNDEFCWFHLTNHEFNSIFH